MKNTNTYLFLDGGWIFSYARLKEVFDRCTSADSRLGWEIIEASSNKTLSAWLRQYGLLNQADQIDSLVEARLDSGAELLNKLKEIVGDGHTVGTVKRKPLSRYARLENVEYQLNDAPYAICDDSFILPESGNYSLNISLKFLVFKAAMEKFPLKLKVDLLNPEDLSDVVHLLMNDPENFRLNRKGIFEEALRQTNCEIKLQDLNLNVSGENETVVVQERDVFSARKLRQGYDYKLTILADEMEIKVLHACYNYNSASFDVNGVDFKMIKVEGGEMGTFYIGETQVTQALWKAIEKGNSNPAYFKGINRPVECVSWDDCDVFVKKINKNLSEKLPKGYHFALPTEAQWEYAAKGGNRSRGYQWSGCNSEDELEDYAWYNDNAKGETHDVKIRKPNELGIYDMSGNVLEWCKDFFTSQSLDHVLRGGSWYYDAEHCRVSYRYHFSPSYHLNHFGFRLALVKKND